MSKSNFYLNVYIVKNMCIIYYGTNHVTSHDR